jgi:hypothetical protein
MNAPRAVLFVAQVGMLDAPADPAYKRDGRPELAGEYALR